MYDALRETVTKVIDLNEDEWGHLQQSFETLSVPARQKITEIGNTEKYLYFVVKGVIRLYCINAKSEEITLFLFAENNFASCYQSFLTQEPAEQALEAVEDCTLLRIDYRSFNRLNVDFAKMNQLTRTIADQRFINSQKIFMGHITRTAEERYLDFEKHDGKLLLRVPLNIIASFLGVTPVSLSRIRQRLNKK
ncbi:Crp/Fnr family transcriptional regulator [Sphingobacterium pedocola]|uniref:Cyclic nucleotide-binding domain-containing protein n=1 Tax=Sphingobacterium pedocola TaxID=2082722 RepID=A0ABR9TA46_9SPHI|nr:Crp/Fnr family transcriptional regulator [Sphingobacterium pedocola]MBE8721902.1 hypothetical protein [Sphingobacterium pedocola]